MAKYLLSGNSAIAMVFLIFNLPNRTSQKLYRIGVVI